MNPTAITLFSGAGGASAGLRMAGFDEKLALEIFSTAIKVFRANFPAVPVIHRDICKVSAEECLEASGLKPGELDLIQASPCCQGYSKAGNQDFADPRNVLFKEVTRLAKAVQPRVVLIENVKGLALLSVMKLWCREIIVELEAAGYHVRTALLDGQWMGLPQRRERLIFLGVRRDLAVEPSFPPPCPARVGCRRLDQRDCWTAYCNKLLIVKEGHIAPTHTRHHQFFWDEKTEFGLESYKYIHGFSDEFAIPCGHRQAVELMGQSLPPIMMFHLAAHIREHILRLPN